MKKLYIYEEYILDENEFLEKAKKDYEDDEEIQEGFSFEEYVEDIDILDYSIEKIIDFDEAKLKSCKTLLELDSYALSVVFIKQYEDLVEDFEELKHRFSIFNEETRFYEEAICDEYLEYIITATWDLCVSFKIDDEIDYDDIEEIDIEKIKGLKIKNISYEFKMKGGR